MFCFTLLFPIVSFHLHYIIVFVFFSLRIYVCFVLVFHYVGNRWLFKRFRAHILSTDRDANIQVLC